MPGLKKIQKGQEFKMLVTTGFSLGEHLKPAPGSYTGRMGKDMMTVSHNQDDKYLRIWFTD